MKFVITEEEKKSILKLYEQPASNNIIDSELVVASRNPFRDNEFESARKSYSPELKEGEMFTEWVKEVKTKVLANLNKMLEGKTFKFQNSNGTESIIKFDGKNSIGSNGAQGIRVESDFSKIKNGEPPFPVISFYAVDNSDISRTQGLGGPSDFRFNFTEKYYDSPCGKELSSNAMLGYQQTKWCKQDIKVGTWQENLFKFIQQNLQDVTKLPDDLFNVKKVSKKTQTDFRP